MRYLDCPEDSLPWRFRQLLVQGSAAIDPAVGMSSLETLLLVSLGKFNVLPLLFSGWDCVGKEKVFLACLLFAEAGVVGRQKWALVLSTSARVSQVTYQTGVGVRYPELVTCDGTTWNFVKFVTQKRTLQGGFLPVFWDVPCSGRHWSVC